MTVVKTTVSTAEGKAVFKRPLWLAVVGEQRHQLSLEDCYQHYLSRYDIEHFFRFGKQKLLMDAYQTPEEDHE